MSDTWPGWEALGVDEGGGPIHLPFPVNKYGEGPEYEGETVRLVCWCGTDCKLHQALATTWELGRRRLTHD